MDKNIIIAFYSKKFQVFEENFIKLLRESCGFLGYNFSRKISSFGLKFANFLSERIKSILSESLN